MNITMTADESLSFKCVPNPQVHKEADFLINLLGMAGKGGNIRRIATPKMPKLASAINPLSVKIRLCVPN